MNKFLEVSNTYIYTFTSSNQFYIVLIAPKYNNLYQKNISFHRDFMKAFSLFSYTLFL